MKKKIKIIIVVIVIAISLLIAIWSLSPPNTESISNVVNNPNKYLGKNIQIKGTVKNKTIKNSTNSITFNLTDGCIKKISFCSKQKRSLLAVLQNIIEQ